MVVLGYIFRAEGLDFLVRRIHEHRQNILWPRRAGHLVIHPLKSHHGGKFPPIFRKEITARGTVISG